MTEQKAQDIYFDTEDAILNEEFPGFKEDYLVLHSLIRKYKPLTFFEIGTNMGTGTNIICNAVYKYLDERFQSRIEQWRYIFSLDLPTELAHISLQHPISEGKGDKVGSLCTFPYIQLRGDSIKFDFSKYPCEGYFIDGEHDEEHVFIETAQILSMAPLYGKPMPKILIFHDADILGVWNGITKAVGAFDLDYELFRVIDTRIAYILRK